MELNKALKVKYKKKTRSLLPLSDHFIIVTYALSLRCLKGMTKNHSNIKIYLLIDPTLLHLILKCSLYE